MNNGWLTLLISSVPQLTGVAAKFYLGSSDTRVLHKVKKDIELYGVAPESSKEVLEDLILTEVRAHAQRRLNAANRKFVWSVLLTVIVGVLPTGLLAWLCAYYAVTRGWWVLSLPFSLVSGFGFAWAVIGGKQIFAYPDDDDPHDEAIEPEQQAQLAKSTFIRPGAAGSLRGPQWTPAAPASSARLSQVVLCAVMPAHHDSSIKPLCRQI